MGQKDLAEKNLEFYPDVFADIVNALLYEGKPVVNALTLHPAPTETLYHSKTGRIRNQFHDVSKYLMQNGSIQIQYTLENETRVKYRMVLRKAGYTGAVYREQLDRGKIFPVIGIVLYWGKKKWRAPRSMHQLLKGSLIQDTDRNYIDDLKLHVFEMAHLPRKVRERFRSDIRIVVDYLTEGADYAPTKQKIRHTEALLLLLEALTGDARYHDILPEILKQEEKGGAITMCELIDKYEKRGIQKGIQKGIQCGTESTTLSSLQKLMKNLNLPLQQAMTVLEIPEEEQQKYMRLIG
ncbi:MAG: Rpn family recombination-promoting nuclease/putative transposase [Lachnospiraceae bacterium]|nr:Rpn family recombination-promoting nuclease/putative transposase [Lachnospiraceae bacterium]